MLSQVILSLQLPFAVVPLVRFTASKTIMGPFASPGWLRVLVVGFHLGLLGVLGVLVVLGTLLVLVGTVALFDGTGWSDAGPGDFLYVPAGGVHAFRNRSGAVASMLMLFSPGAPREEYFAELARIGESGRSLSAQEWQELYARHDQVMVDTRAPEDDRP